MSAELKDALVHALSNYDFEVTGGANAGWFNFFCYDMEVGFDARLDEDVLHIEFDGVFWEFQDDDLVMLVREILVQHAVDTEKELIRLLG